MKQIDFSIGYKGAKVEKAKFEIGDIVVVRGTVETFFITGILYEVCYAGTQIHYTGRLIACNGYGTERMSQKQTRMHEIELSKKAEDSKELHELLIQAEKLQLLKEDKIKKQDFEKAAEYINQRKIILAEIRAKFPQHRKES